MEKKQLVGWQVVVDGEVAVPCCWESYARQYADNAQRLGGDVMLWEFALADFSRYSEPEVEVPGGVHLADIGPAVP